MPYDESVNQQAKDELFANTVESDQYSDHIKTIDTVILDFRDIVQEDAKINKILKMIFFGVCCIILLILTGTLVCMIDTLFRYNLPHNSSPFAVEVVSVIASFIAAFMILPKIIAKHLFNAKIQQSIVDIVTKYNKKDI